MSVVATVDRFFERGGKRLHVHETKPETSAQPLGAPVVLLHSGGFTSRQWKRLVALLGTRHRTVAPDLLAYGQSTPVANGVPFHFREDLELLEALVREVGEPVHLVGHSYGGLLALQIALHLPAQVRSLTLYEPVAFGAIDDVHGGQSDPDLGRIDLDGAPNGTVSDAWLEAFVDWWNGAGAWQSLSPETKDGFRHVGWKVFQEVVSLITDRTTLATYATIATPTLFLAGERSPAVERALLAKLAAALPHARLELLDGVGHMGPVTHADRVNRLVEAHVAETETR